MGELEATGLEATLEHGFAHAELLERALTHSSLAHERGSDEPQREDNETLEFLGDAVVGLGGRGVGVSALSRAFRGSAGRGCGVRW